MIHAMLMVLQEWTWISSCYLSFHNSLGSLFRLPHAIQTSQRWSWKVSRCFQQFHSISMKWKPCNKLTDWSYKLHCISDKKRDRAMNGKENLKSQDMQCMLVSNGLIFTWTAWYRLTFTFKNFNSLPGRQIIVFSKCPNRHKSQNCTKCDPDNRQMDTV